MIKIIKYIMPLIVLLSTASVGFAQSVLSSGEWFKIGIVEEGVHKLDAAFLQQLGLDLSALDPTTIKVFGNGGKMLPQSNSIARPSELLENSILVAGETDGSFDQNDAVFFYGQSPHTLEYDASKDAYFYENNIYSDTTFYFFTYGAGNGKRVEQSADLGSGHPIVNSMRQPQVHELDLANVLTDPTGKGGSGREWYGEIFNTTVSRDFSFEIGSPAINGSAKIIANVLSKSEEAATFKIDVEGQEVSQITIDKITSSTYSQRGLAATDTIIFDNSIISGSEVTINFKYSRPKTSSIGHLNYILLDVAQKLEFNSNQLVFESPSTLVIDSSTFEIANLSSLEKIWDITDPTAPTSQVFSLQGAVMIPSLNPSALCLDPLSGIYFNTSLIAGLLG